MIEIIDIPRENISGRKKSGCTTDLRTMQNIKYITEGCLINLVILHKLTVSGMEVQQVSLVKTLARNWTWQCRRLDWSLGKLNLAKIWFLLLVDPSVQYLVCYNSTITNSNNNNNNSNCEPCSVFGRLAVWFESRNSLDLSLIILAILRFVDASFCKRMQVLSASIPTLWGFQFLFVKGKWK